VLPEPVGGEEVDPLKLLDGGQPKREPLRKAPTAEELDRHSPLSGHYQPPAVLAPPAAAQPPHQDVIPADYDPLCDDFTGRAAAPQTPVVPDRRSIDVPRSQPASLRSPVEPVRAAPSVQDRPSPVPEARLSARETPGEAPTLNELLAGAGLDRVQPTADLARSIGEIFRVVVSGVMDVLQSRQQVKDEFHLPLTRFRPADNNPLKFSANVDDALHNLLVKRNPGYLGPVEAFEDAFDDLRNHQLAVLAGMRVAFESLLAEFDPDRLEKEFDQVKRAPLVGARRRYWDLYRERRDEIAKDPDASFKRLFGEQFARAYEAQLNRLKAERRGRGIVQQGKGAQSSGGR
jgi:type VI secretion system FHA domain protein